MATFSKYKRDFKANGKTLKYSFESELEITKELYELILTDAKIGFEMTNHYYYDENLLIEKNDLHKPIENLKFQECNFLYFKGLKQVHFLKILIK